ncbi:MAG: ParM/StbA family protein [Eubacteriales bacterium]|nr:ParM/StbA family protein [Eubacteriales bacterium]
MIREIRIPVDHGNRNIKTTSLIFTTGLNVLDKKPGRGEEYLRYEGKYYTLSEKRIPYQRDKTKDFRFFILTLFAIAKEIHQQKQILSEDVVQVQLPIGLPPKHFAELYEKYEEFFQGNGQVQELDYCGTKYHVVIQDTMAFPQDFAAMVTRLEKLTKIPKVVGIDIGGFTANYLLMRMGSPDIDYCDSLEMGIITMYNQIISDINSEYDVLLEEADIDSIVKGNTQYYDKAIVMAVEDKVQAFVIDLLHSIRERGIDTKTSYVVFIGGGAVLLKRFIEKTDRLGQYMFIENLRANAEGYGILYQMTKTKE